MSSHARGATLFIVFAEIQEEHFGVNINGRELTSKEIVDQCLSANFYYEQYDALIYDDASLMLKDIQWINDSMGLRACPIEYHSIDCLSKWEQQAATFTADTNNPLLLHTHSGYRELYVPTPFSIPQYQEALVLPATQYD